MNTSPVGLALISEFEGFVGHAYKPVPWERWYTIGFGHYGADVRAGQRITREAALELLRRDVQRFEQAVDSIGAKFTQGQYDALVSLAYNCGPGAVHGTISSLARAGRFSEIPGVMRLYVHAGGHVLPGLVRRREAEIRVFNQHAPAPKPDGLAHLTKRERAWCREYDHLYATHSNVLRRRWLRALMRERRKQLWRLAQKTGWTRAHRRERYHSLLARTT